MQCVTSEEVVGNDCAGVNRAGAGRPWVLSHRGWVRWGGGRTGFGRSVNTPQVAGSLRVRTFVLAEK